MLTSITPLGERGRANRWWVTTTAYVVASSLAGAILGALVGLVGAAASPSRTVGLAVLGGLAVAAAILDATRRRPPSWHRQVDEGWMQAYRGWVYAAGYGGQLGLGVVTIVTSATVYVVLGAELLVGSVWGGAVIGLAFGLARSVPLVGVRSVTTGAALAAMHRRVALAAPRAAYATSVVAAGLGAVALVGAFA